MLPYRRLLSSLAILLLSSSAHSENCIWSNAYGDARQQQCYGIATDSVGNIYAAGFFESSIDFGSSPLASAGNRDVFVAKLDPNGHHLWSKRYGDSEAQEANGIAVDHMGNVVVVGYIRGTTDFGGGPLVSDDSENAFVAKFGPDGSHLWSHCFGDSLPQWGNAVAIDKTGRIVVAGVLSGTADFGGGTITSAGYLDIFLAKFDGDGEHEWSCGYGDPVRQEAWRVAVDSHANVVIVGDFEGSVDFGGSPMMSLGGSSDIFVASFTPEGEHRWSRRFGGLSLDECHAVTVDNSDAIEIAAYISGEADLGGGILSGSWCDVGIARYESDGTHLWSRRFGDGMNQGARSICSDNSGQVVVTGYSSGTVDFGGGPLVSGGVQDVFIVIFDGNGNHVWSGLYGGPGSQVGRSITTDGSGNLVVAGEFAESVDFGLGRQTSAGEADVFIARFGPFRVAGIADVPGDQGGQIQITWGRHGCDSLSDAKPVTTYRVQRRDSGWGDLTTVSAAQVEGYSALVSTPDILTAGQPEPFSQYRIVACTEDTAVSYVSLPDSGYSVDNLAPDAPGLEVFDSEANRSLVWQNPAPGDFGETCLYKGEEPGFEAGESLVCSATQFWYQETDLNRYWYRARSYDIHGNASEWSSEVVGRYPTGVPGPLPIVLRLYPNQPNPFNPVTTLRFDVPLEGRVRLEVFDIAGRLVRTLLDVELPPGSHQAVWDGNDSAGRGMPSGSYFARLQADGKLLTVRMSLVR